MKLKPFIRSLLPNRCLALARYVRSPAARGAARAVRALRSSRGLVVASGPFAGLEYVRRAVGSEYAPKLIGTYEKELHPTLAYVIAHPDRWDAVIDIGAAEGYYAVGLAKRMPSTPIIAFEATASGRGLLRELARANGVAERIRTEGFCSPPLLSTVLASHPRALILSDCEGGELELLDPDRVSGLHRADVLVEVHGRAEVPAGEHLNHPKAMAALLQTRFAPTHEVTVIEVNPRTPRDWPPGLEMVDVADRPAALFETRAEGASWLWMTPKSPSVPTT